MKNGLYERRKTLLLRVAGPVLPLLLGLVVVVGVWRWQRLQRAELEKWHTAAQECRSLAAGIVGLRGKPKAAVEKVVDSHALAGYIERAARKVGMSQTHIRSIHPDYPRRIGSTSYVETATKVRLTEVGIADVAKLVWNLRRESPGLSIPRLRMWTGTTDAPQWEAELKLAALAYSPSQE